MATAPAQKRAVVTPGWIGVIGFRLSTSSRIPVKDVVASMADDELIHE